MRSTAFLTILAFSSVLVKAKNAQDDTSHLRCYVCEGEQTNACQINPDVTTLSSIQCSELQYRKPREGESQNISDSVLARSIDGKFRGAPLVGEIFQGSSRAQRSTDENYVCITLALSSGDMKGVSRLCERHPKHVENVCDFIKQEIPSNFKVDSCAACYTDNCNSTQSVYISFTLLLIVFICHAFANFNNYQKNMFRVRFL